MICQACDGRGLAKGDTDCVVCGGKGEILPEMTPEQKENAVRKYFWGDRASRLAEIDDFDKDYEELLGSSKGEKKKFGLDFHGVIDKHSKVLRHWAAQRIAEGHEVHIVTGSRMTSEFEDELRRFGFVEGISFTHFFSITDYHVSVGSDVRFDDDGLPWMSKELWDPTKGYYALVAGLDALWDDSPSYGKYVPSSCVYITFAPDALEAQTDWLLNGRKRIGR
jgi:hypothetical protein